MRLTSHQQQPNIPRTVVNRRVQIIIIYDGLVFIIPLNLSKRFLSLENIFSDGCQNEYFQKFTRHNGEPGLTPGSWFREILFYFS